MSTAAIVLVATAVLSGAPAGGAATGAPVLSAFTLKPATLRPGERARFRFLTTREGAATIAVSRVAHDRQLVAIGRLRFAVDAGQGSHAFDGRLAGKALRPGRYRATVSVKNDETGTSQPLRLTFTIAG